MPENAHLTGSIGQIDLDFVERETTPQLLMKLSNPLHLAGLSFANTVESSRSSVLNELDRPFLTSSPR